MNAIEMRRQQLLASVVEVLTAHHVYVESPDVGIGPNSRLDMALRAMAAEWSAGDIPGDCRELERAVRSVQLGYAAYVDRQSQYGDFTEAPNPDLWREIERLSPLLSDADQSDYPPLPTPAMYQAEGLTAEQIAVIYDWTTVRGAPDVARVQREILKPSACYADGVPDPRNRVRIQQRERERERMEEAKRKLAAKLEADGPVAHESIEELLLQQVHPAQICSMKRCTMEQVATEADRLGIRLDSHALTDQGPAGSALDQLSSALADLANGGGEDLDEQERIAPTVVIDPERSLDVQLVEFMLDHQDMEPSSVAELFDTSVQKVRACWSRRDKILETA